MSEQNKDAEREEFEAAFEGVFFSSCFEREDDGSYAGRELQGAWLGWQKARSLPVGVPDGDKALVAFLDCCKRIVSELEDSPKSAFARLADAVKETEVAVANAAPTVKESLSVAKAGEVEQVPFAWRDALQKIAKHAPPVNCAAKTEVERLALIAVHALIAFSAPQFSKPADQQAPKIGTAAPSLPAAGSAVEEAEVRGLQWFDTGHYRKKPPQFGYNPHDWNELMTVAQHERIVAALSAQQSAQDVSVPRELLERLAVPKPNGMGRITWNAAVVYEAAKELRALLNGGEA